MQNYGERVVCMADNGLKNVIANLEKACTELKNIEKFSGYTENLQNIIEHTKEPLMLMVMGAFSTGKSTFINALVGEEIAAVEAKPTTAVVTKLCYGDKDVLKVYFRDGKSKIYSPSEFAKLTAVNDVEADNSIHERIDYVERQMPIEMLKQVTIIDSPGLNDVNEKHSEASERFVKNADSVLWMFSALQMGSKFEIEAMDKLTPRLKPIAVINKMDQINDDEDDPDEFLAKAKALLKDKVQAVIGISAKYALQGKLENNKLKSQVGNLDELKNAIETLVVPNREAFKLNTLLDELGYFFAAFNNELRSFKENNKEIGHNDYKLYVQNVKIALQTEETLGLIVDAILEYCEREAGRRNEQAMFLLGVLYDGGIGVLQDEGKAMQLYQKAALKNHLGAMRNMYVYYREGTSNQNKQSLFWLQKLAEAGDDEAQFDYAIDLMKKGDKEAAFNWCKKAAEQGNSAAQFGLYKHYDDGVGVEEDEDLALEWLKKAVAQRDSNALFEYAEYYADEKEEVSYLLMAAEQGHIEAIYKLAECYRNGKGAFYNGYTAYIWYRKAAENGHVEAQNWVGRYLQEGWSNVTKNEKEAVEWYRKAAEQGYDVAQINLAICLYNGQGVAKSEAEAYKWYRKAAENGNANAQNWVGRYLEEGWGGIVKDEYEAVEWYIKAAEQGYDVAQWNLAICLDYGRGVAENKAEAYKWYRKAAEQGHANSQYMVGRYLEEGLDGIAKKAYEAVLWYRKAAEQGHKDAQFKLGQFLCEGKGTAKDKKEGLVWYRKAAEQGHAEAKTAAYKIEGIIKKREAFYNLVQSANNGVVSAQYELAKRFVNGDGVVRNDAEAYKWYRKAAEQGHADSQYMVGRYLEEGLGGIAKKAYEAVQWYRKAAEQGHKDAQFKLGQFLCEGKGTAKDEKEGLVWYKKAAEQGHAEAKTAAYKIEGIIKKREAFDNLVQSANNGVVSAQYELAKRFVNGDGVVRDDAEAYEWYRKAAEQGHADSQYMVGRYLEEGWSGIAKKAYEAVQWYRKAAEQGHKDAQYNLGRCLEVGKGVAGNQAEAYQWYKKAVEQGCAEAKEAVAKIEAAIKKREAFDNLVQSANNGVASAQYELAERFMNGNGVAENKIEAYRWYRKAAEQGHAEAQNLVGRYLTEGWGGIAKDEYEAVEWYRKAAEQGLAAAEYNFAICLYSGVGINVDYRQAFKLYKRAAEHGNIEALYCLGYCYENGKGVFYKDSINALQCYEAAAKKGHAASKEAAEKIKSAFISSSDNKSGIGCIFYIVCFVVLIWMIS